jgi:hypothetical protein
MERLLEIIEVFKASVTLRVNDHKDMYQSVKEYVEDQGWIDVEDDVLEGMIEKDSIIDLHFYPVTPIGFYNITHYDLDYVLDRAIDILKSEGKI